MRHYDNPESAKLACIVGHAVVKDALNNNADKVLVVLGHGGVHISTMCDGGEPSETCLPFSRWGVESVTLDDLSHIEQITVKMFGAAVDTYRQLLGVELITATETIEVNME